MNATTNRVHDLKLLPEFFAAVAEGRKNFEVRRNDRDYRVGDILHLREWRPIQAIPDGVQHYEYTGNIVDRLVTYVLPGGRFGVESGYCVLGMEPLPV